MGELLGNVYGDAKVTQEEMPVTILTGSTGNLNLYTYVTLIAGSIIKASDNGGVIEFRDTNGNTFWQESTDQVGLIEVPFPNGKILDDDYRLGVDAILHGTGHPAEVYIYAEGYYDFRK